MPKQVMMDERHLTLSAPDNLPKSAYTAMRRTLHGRVFLRQIRAAIRGVIRRHPSLQRMRWSIR